MDQKDEDDDDEDDDDDDDEGLKRKLQPGGKDPWLDGCDPWSSARSSARPLGQPFPRSSNMSKRPRNHAADMVFRLQVLDEKIDRVLAGMALAIGPGFSYLLQGSCPDPPSQQQPDAVLSSLTTTARCLVFDICDSDGDDSADSEAAPLDLEGDFKFLPDVQQQLERNASSNGNTKSVDAFSYGGSIADNAPAVDSETDGCAVSVSLSADDGRKILRAIQSMTERIGKNLADSAAAAVSLSTGHLDEELARMRETTRMNQICLEAAHVRPSCANG